MGPSRLLPCAVVLGVVVTLAPAAGARSAPAAATATAVTLKVAPAAPLLNERYSVSGLLGLSGKRLVHLQRRQPNLTWSTVDSAYSTTSGKYAFLRRATSTRAVLRVFAPATATRASRYSYPRVVTTVTQSSTLGITGTRTAATAALTLSPVRTGRTIRLQRLGVTGWRTAATTVQGTGTSFNLPLASLSGLPRQYRVTADAWHGAPAYVGASTTLSPPIAETGLPRINLTTTGGAPIISKDDYLTGTFAIGAETPVTMQIRGRGNGTWQWTKKPYRIKLDVKQPLLGMPTERDWVLLANYTDRSLLRTWTAFETAASTSLGSPGWTPQTRFVDVTLNGVDVGSYQLTEHVEASVAKVQLAPGGLLLEVDSYYVGNGDPGFTTAQGTPIGYKDPDDPTVEQQAAVQASVAAFEAALYGPDFADPALGYKPFVDLNSFADWYLVNEVMKNLDGDFFSSAFVSWNPAGTFTMGPAWDFDLSSGYIASAPDCCLDPSGWWLRGVPTTNRHGEHTSHWYTQLTKDPAFVDLIEQRWAAVVKPAVVQAIADLPAQQALIATSAAFDWWTWRLEGFKAPPGSIHRTDQPGETQFLIDWLNARVAWIDGELD